MKGLKVSTRRTQAHYRPSGSTRAAIARRSRGGGTSNPQPQKKKRSRQPSKVEHADEDVADEEVVTPDWEARGARADQERGPSQSRDAEVDHLDVPDVKNVQAVAPYLTEIHEHYRETEGLMDAKYGYMIKQTDITSKMRSILFDWLVEVHLKFKLVPETLFMTFGLVDRYLEKENVMRSRLQLVGMAAMFISSKYEEVFAPECINWLYISDSAYNKEDLLRMESNILATLDFRQTARSDRASLPPIGQPAAGWQPAVRLAPDSDLHGPAQRRV